MQARITKFGPEAQNTLVKIPIVLGVIDLVKSNKTSKFEYARFDHYLFRETQPNTNHVGTPFGNRILNNSWAVGLT